ncbi:TPA: hypothetical protein ACGN81_005210 [Bacillus cereus]
MTQEKKAVTRYLYKEEHSTLSIPDLTETITEDIFDKNLTGQELQKFTIL